MMNAYPAGDWFTPLWMSRQGYNVQGLGNAQNMYTANQSVNLPTIFANPFRSYNGSYFVPLDALAETRIVHFAYILARPYRNMVEATACCVPRRCRWTPSMAGPRSATPVVCAQHGAADVYSYEHDHHSHRDS